MKKLFLFVFLLIYSTNVYATTTYSNYSDYLYSTEEIESSDTTEVEKVRKYKFYKEILNYSPSYYNYLEKPNDYLFKSNEKIENYASLWSTAYPEEKEDRVIEERIGTYYRSYIEVRRAILTTNSDIKIKEISFYENKEKFQTLITCDNCENLEISKLNDGLKEEITIKQGTIIYIDFITIKQPGLLNIELELEKTTDNVNFQLGIRSDTFKTQDQYLLDFNQTVDKETYNYYLRDIKNNPINKSTIKVTSDNIDNDNMYIIIKKQKEYMYYDYIYKYYNIEKVYLDDYYFEKEGYIKDKDNYIDLYKYRVRNKITDNYIEKEKVITNFAIKKVEQEKLKYINKEVPVIKIKEKEVQVEKKDNYVEKFGTYAIIGIILKKSAYFRKL